MKMFTYILPHTSCVFYGAYVCGQVFDLLHIQCVIFQSVFGEIKLGVTIPLLLRRTTKKELRGMQPFDVHIKITAVACEISLV